MAALPQKNNIQARTRVLIVKVGYQIQAEIIQQQGLPFDADPKIKFVDIQRRIGTNHPEGHNNLLNIKTIKKWWNRRHEFEETGNLNHAPRSGRLKHAAFASDQKIQEVVNFCLNLKFGEHQEDVLKKFGCSKDTLYKYTKQFISWVYSPRQHASDNEAVKQQRINYANWCLTPTGRLIKKVDGATWLDHKLATYFGLNKRHWMQAKIKGDTTEWLEAVLYMLHNPGIMGYFAANKHGVACYIHANKRRKQRGSGNTVDVWSVDTDDCIEAWENEFLEFMDDTNSNYVIVDGVRMQHAPALIDFLDDHHIQVHPSATGSNASEIGYQSYSHPFMPQDYKMFSIYQKNISNICKTYNPKETDDSRLCFLYDLVKPQWETDFFVDLARETINNYANVCQ